MIRNSVVAPAHLLRMGPPGRKAAPQSPSPEVEVPRTVSRDEPRPHDRSLAWMALGALALAAVPTLAQAVPGMASTQETTSNTQETTARATDSANVAALKQAADENPMDNPTADKLKGRYRELLTRTLRELDLFQDVSRELAQYRVMDYTGEDFSITEPIESGTVTVSRRGDTLTIRRQDERGQVTLINSPSRRLVNAKGLTRTLYLTSDAQHRTGDFEVANRRERLALQAGGLSRSAFERGQSVRESFRLPSITIAIYPGPVLEYEMTAGRGGKAFSGRSVTVRQDGGTNIRELLGGTTRSFEEPGTGP